MELETQINSASAPIFEFGGDSRTVRVVIDPDGTPWFAAHDVTNALGSKRARDATRGLDPDMVANRMFATMGGAQAMIAVSESGVYMVVARSRRPEARPFRRWLFTEVLPALARTGQYQGQGPGLPIEVVPATAVGPAETTPAPVAAGEVEVIRAAATAWAVALAQAERADELDAQLTRARADFRHDMIGAAHGDQRRRADLEREADEAKAALATYRDNAAARELAMGAELRAVDAELRAVDALTSTQGDLSLRDAASSLSRSTGVDLGQQRLAKLLRAYGMVDSRKLIYQAHASKLRIKVGSVPHRRKGPDGIVRHTGEPDRVTQSVRVTPAGLVYLAKRIARDGVPESSEAIDADGWLSTSNLQLAAPAA